MRRFVSLTTVLLIFVGAGIAQAQAPVGLELRGGAAFPTQDFGDGTLNTGGGAGFSFNYGIMPHVLVFGGWDWFRLTTDEPFGSRAYDVENTGYVMGLQFQHPVLRNVGGWVRAGGLYGHVELETGGDVVLDSGHEFGWEVGAGLRVPVTGRMALTPGVRYRTLSVDLEMGAAKVPVDLSYVAAEIGFQILLGGRPSVAALVR